MGASHSGHKHDAPEGNEVVDWIEVLELDLASVPEGEEIFPEPICTYCKHFETEWEQDSWEEGGGYYQEYLCFAKDEDDEDVYYGNVIDCFPDECPYFEQKERP